MARTTTAEDAQATAQVNVRIGTSLAEPLHNTTEEDVSASKFLKRAYRMICARKSLVCGIRLLLFHRRNDGECSKKAG